MVLNVHRTIRLIRDGGRGYGGGGRGRVYTYRYTVTTRMTCNKMGSDERKLLLVEVMLNVIRCQLTY